MVTAAQQPVLDVPGIQDVVGIWIKLEDVGKILVGFDEFRAKVVPHVGKKGNARIVQERILAGALPSHKIESDIAVVMMDRGYAA
jgi:hypothetical protein